MLNQINISPDKQKILIYIVLTVVTLAVFWQVHQYDFINFDDNFYVTLNSHIQSGITLDGIRWAFTTKYFDLWNPLIWLSFMFDYQLHGLNAGGYHLTNVILHALSTLLLFWLFHRMTKELWKSAFVAALFALHPLHVESVAWVAERKDVLSAFFWMLTLCLYVYYTEKPVVRRYLLVVFSFVCALMSKPMVVTLPVVMLLLDYWPLGRLQSRKVTTRLMDIKSVSTNDEARQTKFKKAASKRKISPSINRKSPETRMAGMMPLWPLLEKAPFFALSLILVIITFYAPDTTDRLYTQNLKNFPIPLLLRIANAPVAFVTYIEKTFWPHNMAIIYPFPDHIPAGQVIVAVLLILIISAAVMVMARRCPYLFVGWLWYSITILPVIGIIQISFTAPYAMADRYHYLPSIGIAIMLAWGIPVLIQSENMCRKILFPAGVVFIALLSFVTWQQCRYWKNSIELWNHTLRVTKDNYMAYYSLGYALFDEGKFEDAVEQYNKAIRLRPNSAEAFFNRGNAYISFGQYQKALDDFNQAIRLKENYADAYNNRAIAFISQGKREPGCHDAQKACALGNCKAWKLAKCPPLKEDHAETYEKR